jgi:NADH:ubiquinone oxidoreductase subunit C
MPIETPIFSMDTPGFMSPNIRCRISSSFEGLSKCSGSVTNEHTLQISTHNSARLAKTLETFLDVNSIFKASISVLIYYLGKHRETLVWSIKCEYEFGWIGHRGLKAFYVFLNIRSCTLKKICQITSRRIRILSHIGNLTRKIPVSIVQIFPNAAYLTIGVLIRLLNRIRNSALEIML